MNKNRISKFHRVTALFEQGKELVLDSDSPGDPVLVWVSKLNPFEQEEARKDGSVGRSRATMLLDSPDSPEMAVFQQALEGRDRASITDALVYSKQNEDYVGALDDIRALEGWAEKLDVLDRGDEQLADSGSDDDVEHEMLARLNEDYMRTVNGLLEGRQDVRRTDLEAMDDDEVSKAYDKAYRETVASNGFLNEYKISEMYFSLRDCDATVQRENGSWDHGVCAGHRARLCESRADIRGLPEGLLALVTQAIRELTMTPRDAGNSDAPASSSASSEPQSEAAASTPSTPKETSPELAGIS